MPSFGTPKESFLQRTQFPNKRGENELHCGLTILFDISEKNVSGCHANPTCNILSNSNGRDIEIAFQLYNIKHMSDQNFYSLHNL